MIMTQEHKERLRTKTQLMRYLYVVHNIVENKVQWYIKENYKKIGSHLQYVWE